MAEQELRKKLIDKIDVADSEEITSDELKSRANLIWIITSAGLLLALIIVLIWPPFANNNEVVAIVNGDKIYQNQLYDELVKANGSTSLDELVNEVLVGQAADKQNIKISDKQIQAELDKVKSGFSTEEDFSNALKSSGYTLPTLKAQLKHDLIIRVLLKDEISITDDEIAAYYDTNKANYDTPAQIRASHILVNTKAEAEAILKQLQEGGDFAAIAKEKSVDPNSGANGGDLGFFGSGDMVPEFEAAAFALKNPGDLSGIVQSSFGFHIIKLSEKKAAVESTLASAKDQIIESLTNDKISEAYSNWINQQRENAKIDNKLGV